MTCGSFQSLPAVWQPRQQEGWLCMLGIKWPVTNNQTRKHHHNLFHTFCFSLMCTWCVIANTYGANTISLLPFVSKNSLPSTYDMWWVSVRWRRTWRGQKCLCPQMMCGWHRLCQTGQQVALGSHSGVCVYEPCCNKTLEYTKTQGISTPKASWGGGRAALRWGISQPCSLSVPYVCNNRNTKSEATQIRYTLTNVP